MSLDSNVVYLGFLSLYVYVSILMLFIFDSRLFMSMSTSMSLYVYVYVSILMSTILVSLCLPLCVYSNVVYLQLLSLCHLSLYVYVYVSCLYSNVVYIRFLSARVSGNTLRTFQHEKKGKTYFLRNKSIFPQDWIFIFYYIGVNITECLKSYISIQKKYI